MGKKGGEPHQQRSIINSMG